MFVRGLATLVALTVGGVASAGDHYYFPAPVYAGHTVSNYSPSVIHMAPASSVYVTSHSVPVSYVTPVSYVAPVSHAAPMVSYQPAYVVPTTVVASYPYATYATTQVYAPMVPSYHVPRLSMASYYSVPRPLVFGPVYTRHGRPRDVEIELKYRRDGGYRYEVDFD